jgi:threonine dehydrogenase-like Zn-dependent dehydrogenase
MFGSIAYQSQRLRIRKITHRLNLQDAAHGYDIFKNKKEDCVKVILQP